MSCYYLPIGKLHKQTRIRKLNNLPNNFETDFYKNYLIMSILPSVHIFKKKCF